MTREEAIHFAVCLMNNWTINFADMEEFCDMAIEALQREEAEANGYCHRIKPKEDFTVDGIPQDWTPTILGNVEVVVRCKDCKHRSDGGWCDVYIQPRIDTDFCNNGERKGGDSE